jgi:SpoIID/LytB domain protein
MSGMTVAGRTPVSGRTRRRLWAAALGVATMLAASAAVPATAAIQGSVTFSGQGYGHGRGLSQWGSLGYAVDHGWDYRRILAHYYGGTDVGSVPNGEITVELISRRGSQVVFYGQQVHINGVALGDVAVRVRRQAAGQFAFDVGPGCGGPFQAASGVLPSGLHVYSTAVPTAAGVLKVCDSGGTSRGYRGSFQVVEGAGHLAVVNRLPIEEYLMGVVPRESPSSWGTVGGGKGMHALRAQAVAARSYAVSGGWNSYAKTCDTVSCQVYGGTLTVAADGRMTSLEAPQTNQAIAETAGEVRQRNGAVMRTEFSSSSGGWTAGGTFPAVEDRGDGTGANPHRNWAATIDAGVLATRLGTASITGLTVTARNGLGAGGGRVLSVAVDTTAGRRTFTGNQIRSALGLKSDWFSISYNAVSLAHSASFVRGLYNDILKRAGGDAEVNAWAQSVAGGTNRAVVASAFVGSMERLRVLVAQAYQGGLRRSPDEGGYRTWTAYLQSGATLNDLNAAIYGSPESYVVLGGGNNGQWVDGMYQGILGRSAGPNEQSYWTTVANQRGRGYVAWQISASYEARLRRLDGYYREILQRPVDPAGMASWMPLMIGRGDFDVQTFIAGSLEYWLYAPGRFP